MKITIVMPYFYPAKVYGGPIFASYNLCKYAASPEFVINVITTDANGINRLNTSKNIFQSLHNFSVKYCREDVPKYFSSSFIFHLWRDLKQSDIVHIQSMYSYTTFFALIFCFFQKKKVFLSPRGCLAKWSFTKRGFIKKIWLEFLIAPFVKNIVWHATSEKEKNEILHLFKKSEIKILSDGVVISSDLDLKKNKWTFENYIAALGRIHKVKGFDLLIESMVQITNYNKDIKLFIAGNDDGDLLRLKKIVSNLNLEEKVQFVGAIDHEDKDQFLANAKCLILPSHTENFGIVVAEALALGTPVVASKNTPWEILESSKAGKYVENNPNDIAKGCISILDSLKDYKSKTKLLAKQYDWKNIAIQYIKILKSL